jgi:protein TonB
MNWPRLTGVALALCLHGGVFYSLVQRSGPDALAEGNGDADLTVVATVSLDSGDLFTQSAQEAAVDANASQAARLPDLDKQEPDQPEKKIEVPRNAQTETPKPDETSPPQETPPEPERPSPEVAPPGQQKSVTQMASVAAEAQEEQRAAAAIARRNKSWSSYETELYSMLERHKVKPHAAKTGDVLLLITIAPSGQLLSRAVANSSGVPELDGAAIAALERSAPFPPVPPDVSSGPLTLTVPFRFRTR